MVHRTRINYTPTQKTEMWDRWQRGETLKLLAEYLIGLPPQYLVNYRQRVAFGPHLDNEPNQH